MISVPRGENRSFRNVSNELGRLLVMIVPETDEQVDPVSYADAPHALDLLRARRERPCCRTADERDERAPLLP